MSAPTVPKARPPGGETEEATLAATKIATKKLQNVKKPGCDGSLEQREIHITIPLAEHIADCTDEHFNILVDSGVNVKFTNELVRLLNDDTGAARWTTQDSFHKAMPKPKLHPAHHDREQRVKSQSLLGKQRRIISDLHEKSRAEEKIAEKYYAAAKGYEIASRAHFFANVGAVAWHHLSKDYRSDQLRDFRATATNPNCCEEAQKTIDAALPFLSGDTSLGEGLIELDYGAKTPEEDALFSDFVNETVEALWAWTMSGANLESDVVDSELLENVHTVLDGRVSSDIKIEAVALAMILWPTQPFMSNMPGLEKFINDHDNHLDQLDKSIEDAENNDDDSKLAAAGIKPMATGAVPASTSGQITALGAYVRHFNGLNDGYKYLYKARRTLDLDDTDDVLQIQSSMPHYVRQIYDAIRARPEDETAEQVTASKVLEKKLREIGDPDKYIEAIANCLLKALLRLHKEGDKFFPAQIKLEAQDRTMTATQRMDAILDALKNSKRITIDLLLGYDNVIRFVASPVSHQKRKEINSRGNKRRKEGIEEGKAAVKKLKSGGQLDDSPSPSSTARSLSRRSKNSTAPKSAGERGSSASRDGSNLRRRSSRLHMASTTTSDGEVDDELEDDDYDPDEE